jgi:predicted nucleotidyltransferase
VRKTSQVILFGPYARGEQRQDSDLDFLVIEPEGGLRSSQAAASAWSRISTR